METESTSSECGSAVSYPRSWMDFVGSIAAVLLTFLSQPQVPPSQKAEVELPATAQSVFTSMRTATDYELWPPSCGSHDRWYGHPYPVLNLYADAPLYLIRLRQVQECVRRQNDPLLGNSAYDDASRDEPQERDAAHHQPTAAADTLTAA